VKWYLNIDVVKMINFSLFIFWKFLRELVESIQVWSILHIAIMKPLEMQACFSIYVRNICLGQKSFFFHYYRLLWQAKHYLNLENYWVLCYFPIWRIVQGFFLHWFMNNKYFGHLLQFSRPPSPADAASNLWRELMKQHFFLFKKNKNMFICSINIIPD